MKYRLNSLNKAHKRVETCFIMTSTYVHPDCTLSLMHQYSQVVDLIIKIIPHRRSEQPMNDCRRLLKNVSSNLEITWTNQVWIKEEDMKWPLIGILNLLIFSQNWIWERKMSTKHMNIFFSSLNEKDHKIVFIFTWDYVRNTCSEHNFIQRFSNISDSMKK